MDAGVDMGMEEVSLTRDLFLLACWRVASAWVTFRH